MNQGTSLLMGKKNEHRGVNKQNNMEKIQLKISAESTQCRSRNTGGEQNRAITASLITDFHGKPTSTMEYHHLAMAVDIFSSVMM